jgi:cellulose synthase/poly-beta-1,6-N-acetylglucosamine synthase-like glycosyltransferase
MQVVFAVLWWLYIAIQVILASFLVQPLILFLIYGAARLFSGKKRPGQSPPNSRNYTFSIIITSHQETTFLPPIVDSLLKQNYPHFHAYVVADDCDTSGLHFNDPRIILLEPPTPLNSKTKSIRYALEHFKDDDEVLVIFDPDNLVHPQFLEILNTWYNKGYKAVQGNLGSKNMDGNYEKMDNVGVIFNNFIDRDSRVLLGLSGNIWGCGVSVDRKLYEKIIYDSRSQVGGFDKRMQAEIAKNTRIGYAADAMLYDEKVEDGKNLQNQRNRWIRAYFKFLAEALDLFFTGIRRFDFNLSYFGYNLTRPPYFLQILTALFFIVLNYFVNKWLCIAWVLTLMAFVLSFVAIVIAKTSDKSMSKGIWYMPVFFYHQVMALFNIRKSKNAFLKTGHTKILYIDDLLKNGSHH